MKAERKRPFCDPYQGLRHARPGDVALRVGEHITVVNDDENFVHQAYIDHEAFAFDSGDIVPGDQAVITFPTEGDFTVLCGVHPKMKLAVHVR